MQVHRFIALTTGAMLHKAGTAAFNLDTASSLLLYMFHIRTTMSNDLCTEIKAWDWLEINWNSLLRPFALSTVKSVSGLANVREEFRAYTAKFVPLDLVWLSSPESPLINEIRELLLH
jgi:hypothetical protein